MDPNKREFIEFLLEKAALKVGPNFSLKNKRIAPHFINVGDFNDGESVQQLGESYARALFDSGIEFDILYGIPEKGNALAVATAITLVNLSKMHTDYKMAKNLPWFFTRKEAKEYGEATGVSQEDRLKALVVGRKPKKGDRIAQLDDVFTAGDAKYQARDLLLSLGEFKLPVLAIAVDRMEVGIDGRSAIEEYEEKTGTKVISVVNALDIYDSLKLLSREKLTEVQRDLERVRSEKDLLEAQVEKKQGAGIIEYLATKAVLEQQIESLTILEKTLKPESLARMSNYLRVYGTPAARTGIIERCGKLEQKIIQPDRSVIPACDVETLEQFEELVKQTSNVEGIGGYKVGFSLGLTYGLPAVVAAARKHTDKPIIYDHQKAGTDIPDTGKDFAKTCKNAGVDAVIFFPQAGPETERAWIFHALDNELKVIVGGRMTHPAYSVSEGGFITDEGALDMYRIAARAGINNFVVPGNKPDVIKIVKETVEAEGVSPVFYAPGFIAQGGKIEDAAKVAGDRFHGIVGRGIYKASDMHTAALEHTSQLA